MRPILTNQAVNPSEILSSSRRLPICGPWCTPCGVGPRDRLESEREGFAGGAASGAAAGLGDGLADGLAERFMGRL